MKRHCIITLFSSLCLCFAAKAQIDTASIYSERRDSLQAAVFTDSSAGMYLSKTKDIRTEVISAAGLCKMACCNLAESFENSSSVTVGYSDAVTGARQIRLLGQNGIYTQMLDENRPVMRGLSAPFGLNFVPGQWLESIQIAKGVTSVINGVESMTGQINMEHRKPTDEKPLFVQASFMDDTKTDINVISALQLDEMEKWSTVIMAHVDGNFKECDHNADGFMDDPRQLQFNIGNRWLYYSPDGTQLRFGVRAVRDQRRGGQLSSFNNPWQSDILNHNVGAYFKAGFPLNDQNTSNIALISDYTFQSLESQYGMTGLDARAYDACQQSAFLNLLYQNQDNDSHHFTLGLSAMSDWYRETFGMRNTRTSLADVGAFGEYTYRHDEDFTAILGLRGDWYNLVGFRFSPRLTVKWQPSDWIVLRGNAGRGLRYSTPLVDNFGVLSTAKTLEGDYMAHPLEDTWTIGANATWYIGSSTRNFLSVDYFHTAFSQQMLVDYNGQNEICFYTLGSIDGGKSYTDNFQADLSLEPVRRLTVTLTGRITDARQTLRFQSDNIKPMTSLYKAVLNVQWATNLNRWIFDFTASLNGPCRVWDFMRGYDDMYADGYTSAFPLLYAQVTKRFRGFDVYLGGENLTGYRQPSPILNPEGFADGTFDASCVWGPLMGAKVYAGIRMTIWKKE